MNEKNDLFKTVLWILGAINELKRAGLVGGGKRETTDKGLAAFDQLHASGFRPSQAEVIDYLAYESRVSRDMVCPTLVSLILRWEDAVASK